MRWLTLLLALSLLAGCDGGGDRSRDVRWELSGVWELDSNVACTSAFLNDTQLDMVEASFADNLGPLMVDQMGNTGRIYEVHTDFERTTTLSGDEFSYSYQGTVLDGPGDFDVFGTVLSDDLAEIREEVLATSIDATLTCLYFMRKV